MKKSFGDFLRTRIPLFVNNKREKETFGAEDEDGRK